MTRYGQFSAVVRRRRTAVVTEVRNHPTVLGVDDNPDLRTLAEVELSGHFEVVVAEDGPDCMTKAAAHRPDVIVLDMMMPGMSGTKVLEKLSEDPRTREFHVLFLSALTDVNVRVQSLNLGAVDFISRPVEASELVARVSAAVRRGPRPSAPEIPDEEVFSARLSEEMARAARSGAPLSVLAIEIDGAQATDDYLLSLTGEELRSTLRTSDALFRRPAGFWALLPDTPVATAYLAAVRCRQAVRGMRLPAGPASVSIGILERTNGKSVAQMADSALRAPALAQESGGDRSRRADDPRRRSLDPVALSEDLTEREWDVLAHLLLRRTEQDIARRLGISPGTVRSHKARIRRKLHVAPDIRLAEFARSHFRDLMPLVSRAQDANDRDRT